MDVIQELIQTLVPPYKVSLVTWAILVLTLLLSYVHQYDEELNEIKKKRRPGRPASTHEDLLMVKIEKLQKEYQSGFRKCLVGFMAKSHLANSSPSNTGA